MVEGMKLIVIVFLVVGQICPKKKAGMVVYNIMVKIIHLISIVKKSKNLQYYLIFQLIFRKTTCPKNIHLTMYKMTKSLSRCIKNVHLDSKNNIPKI